MEKEELNTKDWQRIEKEFESSLNYLINTPKELEYALRYEKEKRHRFPEWFMSVYFLDFLRSKVSISQIVGKKVHLKKCGNKGEYKGLSCFKFERTPSLTVSDQKGFYYCFSSGEWGDIFTFLMKTGDVKFLEAVIMILREAKLPFPKRNESLENYFKRVKE
jgi:hypothetical protein